MSEIQIGGQVQPELEKPLVYEKDVREIIEIFQNLRIFKDGFVAKE